jgi:hypothetical protein
MYVAALVSAGSLPAPAYAHSVWYELDMWAGNASGTLNGVRFANADVQLDFFGDTSTVEAYSVKNPPGAAYKYTNGYVNLTSTSAATFGIYSYHAACGCYTTVGKGNFEPSARIFVSVDNTNEGLGIGAFGVPPRLHGLPNPAFPGPAIIYPGGILTGTRPGHFLTDLRSNYYISAWQLSCWNFPHAPPNKGCPTGKPLATSAGPLVLNQATVGWGQFNAQVFAYSALQPMSSLSASVAVRPAAATPTTGPGFNDFRVEGSFVLGEGPESIVDPATQEVTLRLGSQAIAIPAGSFEGSNESGYTFAGRVGGIALRASLTPQGAATYSIQVEGQGVPPLADRFPLRLTIGPHIGKAPVKTVAE